MGWGSVVGWTAMGVTTGLYKSNKKYVHQINIFLKAFWFILQTILTKGNAGTKAKISKG